MIGVDGGLPWRVRADMRKFRALTMGKPLVMGRKTFESIGRVLDGRDVDRGDAAGRISRRPASSSRRAWTEALAIARGARGGARRRRDLRRRRRRNLSRGDAARRPPLCDACRREAGGRHAISRTISPDEWAEVSREPLPASEGDTATGGARRLSQTPLSLRRALRNLPRPRGHCQRLARVPITRANVAGGR